MKNVKKNFCLRLIIMCLFSMVLALCGISLLNNSRIQTESLQISDQLVTTSAQSDINSYNVGTDFRVATDPDSPGALTTGQWTQATHSELYKFGNWNVNKWEGVALNITCDLPENETIPYGSLQSTPKPRYADYFNYKELDRWQTGGGNKVMYYISYEYTSPKGNGSGVYTVSPNTSLTVVSFTQPKYSWEGSVKKSTLKVYGESSSFAENSHTQEYGTTKTLTVDTVMPYNSAIDREILYISSANKEGTSGMSIRKDGYYLKGWQVKGSLIADAKFDAATNTYTFGGADGAVNAVWERLKYLIIFRNADNNYQETGRKTLYYGDIISNLPSAGGAKTGYSGAYYIYGNLSNPLREGTQHTWYGSPIIYADWIQTPIEYPITWDANKGTFPDGASKKLIKTTFDSPYVGPENEPVRPGYNFIGWYTSETGGYEIIPNETKMTDVNVTNLYARWEVRTDLDVTITSDENVWGFNLKIEEMLGDSLKTTNLNNITSHSCKTVGDSKFTFSKITVDAAWRFDDFVIIDPKTQQAAVIEQDYAIAKQNDVYVITVFTSLEIKLTTCIEVEIKAVSNFKGQYELNDIGGKIKVGDGEFASETLTKVNYNDTLILNAEIDGINAEFLGWYSAYSATQNFDSYKLSDSLTWETPKITASQPIYAVFKFTHYKVNIYTYSDDKNFKFKQSDSDLGSNDIDSSGGIISLQFKHDNQIIHSDLTTDGAASVLVPLGNTFEFVTTVNSYVDTRYNFYGLYTDFNVMKADFDNNDAYMNLLTASVVVDKTLTQSGSIINFYAKFVKQYAFTVQAGEGVTNVGLGVNSSASAVTKYYYYSQNVENISCTINEVAYNVPKTVWQVLKGQSGLNQDQIALLNAQNITFGITMPAEPVIIKASAEAKYFDLVIYALFKDYGQFSSSTQGGKGYIQTLNTAEVKFDDNNGEMVGASNRATALVRYNSSAAVLKISVNEYQGMNAKYVFSGWYAEFDNTEVANKLNTNQDGSYVIKNFTTGASYYCVFELAKTLQIIGDERVDDIQTDDVDFEKNTNPETGMSIFNAYVTYNLGVKFEIKLSRGSIKYITQIQTEGQIKLTYNDTKTIVELIMPYHTVSIQITTEPGRMYALTVKAVVIDNLQGYYDDEEGYDKNAGYVEVNEVETVGTTLQFQAEEASLRTLSATANDGYSFFGWYKLKTDVSFTKIVKEGAPSYRSNVESWLNIYDADTNPTGAYTYFSANEQVKTDPIERIDKNLYVAVFVKNYNLTLIMGDAGIKDITFEANSGLDRNNDGSLDSANETVEKLASLQIISAAYGTNFEVFTSIVDKYTFMHFEILSGETSLGHYVISNGKILASEVNPNENYRLEFFLYDNIQIVARTVTEYRQLTVNIFTLDIDGNPVKSMEGGTFYFADKQGQVFDMVIGAALAGFVRVNKGFVFKGFKVGENQYSNFAMPDENVSVDVFFQALSCFFIGKFASPACSNVNV